MKKTILLLALLCASVANAQIAPITTTQKDYEWLTREVYHKFSTDKYTLYIFSDNEFEDKYITVPLGTGASEALESLRNLRSVMDTGAGQQFTMNGYKFNISDWKIQAIKSGDLYYTAGSYIVSKWSLDIVIKRLDGILHPASDSTQVLK